MTMSEIRSGLNKHLSEVVKGCELHRERLSTSTKQVQETGKRYKFCEA